MKLNIIFSLLLFCGSVMAQQQSNSNYMDFEDDIVGGRGESLFNSIVPSNKGAKLDSILYLRSDFNEFFQQEFKKSRGRPIIRKRLHHERVRR